MSVFQDLYDSEINFHISTMWDGGFEVKLGDEMNGFKATENFTRFGSIEGWLIQAACHHCPDSAFARVYTEDAPRHLAIRNVDRGQEIRTQVMYMAKDCAKSPGVEGVIAAADILADYIVHGKKPSDAVTSLKPSFWFADSKGNAYRVEDTPIDPPQAA